MKSMIPSALKEILKCIFPEDASPFSASKCDQSDEETIEKKNRRCGTYVINFLSKEMYLKIKMV